MQCNHTIRRALIGVLAGFWLTACGASTESETQDQQQALPVQVQAPAYEEVTLWDEYVGRFQAVERVEIRPRVSGYLDTVHFTPGDIVAKGDLLVSIDPRPFQAEITRIEAVIAQAESRLKLAESRTRRAKTLLDARAGSREEFEETQQGSQTAIAEIAAAKAQLQAAQLELEFTRIRSPIDGRVGEDLVNAGNLVSAAETLLTTVVSIDPIYFAFTGSEQDFLNYSRLDRSGQRGSSRDTPNPVRIRLADQDAYTVDGRMSFIDNAIDENTATISARATVDNSDGFLTPGMYGELRLYGRDPFEALLIPEKLIRYDQSEAFVWTVGQDDTAKKVFITPGRKVDETRVIVEDGLARGDRLVTSNVMALRPGAPLQPMSGQQASQETSSAASGG